MDNTTFYRCSCFATDNIYLKEYGLHVSYTGKEKFWADYGPALHRCGIDTDEQKRAVIQKVESEILRRQQELKKAKSRREIIKKKYVPKHPEVYSLNEDNLHPAFLKLVEATKRHPEKAVQGMTVLSCEKRLYSFPVFKEEFCKKLIEELENFDKSDMPKERPNTMNQYGVLLSDLGFDEKFLVPLRDQYLTPISHVLFPELTGSKFDSHKAFTVTYMPEKEDDLGYHFDNAEVTINICLGKTFRGGEIYFSGMRTVSMLEATCFLCCQIPGTGILHRGQQWHGALSIYEGTRINMVVWMRSSEIRNKLCPMCEQVPRLVPSDTFGDGFKK